MSNATPAYLRYTGVEVQTVSALPDYRLQLAFSDGFTGIFDVSPYLQRGALMSALASTSAFEQVQVEPASGSIVWPNGADFPPSLLRQESVELASQPESTSTPENTIPLFGKIRSSQLHYGDNLDVLRQRIPDESVDLVYLDPPFNSKRSYNVLYRTPSGNIPQESLLAFEDYWTWDGKSEREYASLMQREDATSRAVEALRRILGDSDLMAYLVMIAPRLIELRRCLKPSGSIYLHCDQTASHYLKVLLDAVFGADNFLNNVVWLYGLGGSSKRYWPRKHDDLLWYSKSPGNQYFEPPQVPARSNRMAGQTKKMPDYWDIPSLNNKARERLGYPTQKPVRLLENVVRSSSPEGGVVLDPFCGCGTTIEASEMLGRTWVGIDISFLAVDIVQRRMQNRFGSDVQNRYRSFGQPHDLDEAQSLFEHQRRSFDQWAVSLVDGEPRSRVDDEFSGLIRFPMSDGDPDGVAGVQVPGATANSGTLSRLRSAIDEKRLSAGVVVPLRRSAGLERVAEDMGSWEWAVTGETFPRLQVVSVEEILQGRKPLLPPALTPYISA